jgi:hypothetical protein
MATVIEDFVPFQKKLKLCMNARAQNLASLSSQVLLTSLSWHSTVAKISLVSSKSYVLLSADMLSLRYHESVLTYFPSGIHHILHNHPCKTCTSEYSVAFSPQANYTDWATATCRRNLVPTFVDRGVSRGQRGGSPTVVNLSFLDRVLQNICY